MKCIYFQCESSCLTFLFCLFMDLFDFLIKRTMLLEACVASLILIRREKFLFKLNSVIQYLVNIKVRCFHLEE